ncbi:NHLP leader peptide family natural product precursor [Paenibacillus rhizovicinus]|uniref:NHLP leader peptide family natural product n=1 Tax=Paenibacillus rhizovicinus TaxID=2704463 RepID=A0A6C0NVC1_9BACL|nr:NHLP leader peptide family RiPP precursor [Paenibacillus rhizovicinus]QHW29876.1 NHLP leader peptide family natural product precursor [Paenibacillus rhizovicinus]
MKATLEQSTTVSLREQIIAKAWSDPAFKAALVSNPKAALKQYFELDLPEEMKLIVAEEKKDQLMFVIPPSPSEYAQDLIVTEEAW